MEGPEAGDASKTEIPTNQDPALLTTAFYLGIGTVQSYGWFIIGAFILILYLRHKFGPAIEKWRLSREEEIHKKYDIDPDVATHRLESMERARRRMQEQFDAQAESYAEKQKRREEEKRKEKIENWDAHVEGRGYSSKYKPKEADDQSSALKRKPKKPLRQTDYNPLIGDGSSYRPPRRSGFSGG